MTKSVSMTGEPKVALWSCAYLLGPTPTIVSHCQTFSTFFHQWVERTNLLHCLSSFPFLFRGWDAYRFQDCRVSSRIYSIIMYPIFAISCFWWRVSRISVSVTRHLATLQVCWPLLFLQITAPGNRQWRRQVRMKTLRSNNGRRILLSDLEMLWRFFCRWMDQPFHWEIPSVHAIYDSSSKRNVLISRNTCLFIHATLKREVYTCMYK